MANKRKSEGGGLGPHVRALRGQRTEFEPDVGRTFQQFLLMLNRRYSEAERAAAGRHDGVNGAIKDGIRRRYAQLASAALVFLGDSLAPWSRVQWHRAAADLETLVADLAREGSPTLTVYTPDAE